MLEAVETGPPPEAAQLPPKDGVIVRPLSLVTVLPFTSRTDTTIVVQLASLLEPPATHVPGADALCGESLLMMPMVFGEPTISVVSVAVVPTIVGLFVVTIIKH